MSSAETRAECRDDLFCSKPVRLVLPTVKPHGSAAMRMLQLQKWIRILRIHRGRVRHSLAALWNHAFTPSGSLLALPRAFNTGTILVRRFGRGQARD